MGDNKPIQVPVEVEVDFTGITYDPQTNEWRVPKDAPVFSLKGKPGKGVGKTIVKPGASTIMWTVTPTGYASDVVPSLPSGRREIRCHRQPQVALRPASAGA